MKSIFILLFLYFFICTNIDAQDSSKVENQKYRISIENKEVLYDFEIDTIDIQIYAPNVLLKGFALKIATQTQYYNIDEIIPGNFFTQCNWEFFNSRQVISEFSTENILQVWQIVGLSEIIADSISPGCYSQENKTTLAKAIISRNKFAQQPDSIIPIFFLWENCSDNTVSGMSGNDLYVSEKVLQFYDNQPSFLKNHFPTTQGIPTNCTKASALNAPIKAIEFLHGSVLLKDRNLYDTLILNR